MAWSAMTSRKPASDRLGASGWAESRVTPVEGRGPQFKTDAIRREGPLEIGKPINSETMVRNCRRRCTGKRELLSESRMREICMSGCVSSEGWHVQQETNLPG